MRFVAVLDAQGGDRVAVAGVAARTNARSAPSQDDSPKAPGMR